MTCFDTVKDTRSFISFACEGIGGLIQPTNLYEKPKKGDTNLCDKCSTVDLYDANMKCSDLIEATVFMGEKIVHEVSANNQMSENELFED